MFINTATLVCFIATKWYRLCFGDLNSERKSGNSSDFRVKLKALLSVFLLSQKLSQYGELSKNMARLAFFSLLRNSLQTFIINIINYINNIFNHFINISAAIMDCLQITYITTNILPARLRTIIVFFHV